VCSSDLGRSRIGKRRIYLHKAVAERMGINGIVDHINRNRLDCRRENLRLASATENNANQTGHFDRFFSRYKGVTIGRLGKDWRAQISVNGKTKGLGTYKDETIAAKAYDSAALFLFGEFAVCNFPGSSPKSPSALVMEARRLRNKWGCPGVTFSKRFGTFRVFKLGVGRYETVGSYRTLDEAISASKAANPGV
jgi:hypothetical protein